MMRIANRHKRAGFTLTEMMVATALCLFIMAVIAQAFGSATKTFSNMRTAGQLQEKLRGGITVIRRDLANDHFGPPYTFNGGPHVANQRMELPGWVPPESGYFEMVQVNPNSNAAAYVPSSYPEPALAPVTDPEGLWSTRADGSRANIIRFTTRVPNGPPNELFNSELDPHPNLIQDTRINEFPFASQNIVYSRWVEVAYFLVPEPSGATTPSGNPLYVLCRRTRQLAPKGVYIAYDDPASYPPFAGKTPALGMAARYPDMAIVPIPANAPSRPFNGFYLMGPDDLTDRNNRMGGFDATGLTPNGSGGDILMTDVLSYEVKAAWISNPNFNIPGGLYSGSSPNPTQLPYVASVPAVVPSFHTDSPFYDLPRSTLNTAIVGNNRAIFDTWGKVQTYPTPPFPAPPIGPGTVNINDSVDWNKAETVAPGFLAPGVQQPPLRINMRALQIKIRIWDPKAQQARQVTIVQEI